MKWKLETECLEVTIVSAEDGYAGSRFDASGNVQQVYLKDAHSATAHTFLSAEKDTLDRNFGFGLVNEFDISGPDSYRGAQIGDCFHKIGVGALQRTTGEDYFFARPYDIDPLRFEIDQLNASQISFRAKSREIRGMQYAYEKSLLAIQNKLEIHYRLQNTGSISIHTEEYQHNFVGLGGLPVSQGYKLSFDQSIDASTITKTVNPGDSMRIGSDCIRWQKDPDSDFFIEHLFRRNPNLFQWTLRNSKSRTAVSEQVDFVPTHVNLWGKARVISPEFFHQIKIQLRETAEWKRVYEFSDY